MESFGAFIKAERERKGVSLREISNATKISHHILEALESDHVEKFPYPAFAKGFLSTYAKQLGLDSNEVISRYADFVQHTCMTDHSEFLINERQRLGKVGFDQNKILTRAERMHHRRVLPTFMIVFLIVGIWFAWSIFLRQTSLSMHESRSPLISQNIEKMSAAISPAAGEKDVLSGTGIEQDLATAAETGQEPFDASAAQDAMIGRLEFEKTLMNVPKIEKSLHREPVNASGATEPKQTEKQAASEQKTVSEDRRAIIEDQPIKPVTVASLDTSLIGDRLFPGTSPHSEAEAFETVMTHETEGPKKELVITAVERTWIDVSIDDIPSYDFILEEGDKVKLNAHDEFSLLIGNAGGVILTYQGEPVGPLGEFGKVVRLRLPQ
ncbi:MAG: helix-turn-helix domain-containing protein [bacterium]